MAYGRTGLSLMTVSHSPLTISTLAPFPDLPHSVSMEGRRGTPTARVITRCNLNSNGYPALHPPRRNESILSARRASTGVPRRSSLPIAFAHHNVIRPEDRHGVRDHVATRHMVERPHVDERGGADLQPIGLAAALADDVKAELAFVGFGAAIDLARRRVEPLRKQLELLDHGFQIREHAVLGRQRDTGHVRHDRAFRYLVQALPDDLDTLLHFQDTDPVSIVGIAVFSHRHAEFALGVRPV